jgi:hypothetical protein
MEEAPSMLAAGVPKNSAEIKRNARAFGQALTNAISEGKYGGANINSIYSLPELPLSVLEKSDTNNPAMRLAMRAINGRWPMREKYAHGGPDSPGQGLPGHALALRPLQQPAEPLCVPGSARPLVLQGRLRTLLRGHAFPAMHGVGVPRER